MLEDKLKKIIIEKYSSVKQFAEKINVPYTTVDTILKRGVDNSNVVNVIKMCKELNISVDKLIDEHKIVYLKIADNEFDKQVEQIALDNGIKIIVDKNAPLTAQGVLDIQKTLTEIMETRNKPESTKDKHKDD